MPYPFHLLEKKKFDKKTASDIEASIRDAMERRYFLVEKEKLDETGSRFRLHFHRPSIHPEPDWRKVISNMRLSGVEIIEWSDGAEIMCMWAHTPPDWYAKIERDLDKVLEERYEVLEWLSNVLLKQFPGEDVATDQGEAVKPEKISERVEALNRLAVLWVKFNQSERMSKNEDMSWFLSEYATQVGLTYVSVNEFKKHLPKAYKAKIIDKDKKRRRFIPKLAT